MSCWGYSEAETNIIASIARYHRKTLPKKRHESWQNLISKEDKTLVLEMSLILRLAASLDQRPDKVISCLLYTSPSPRDSRKSRMPSSA